MQGKDNQHIAMTPQASKKVRFTPALTEVLLEAGARADQADEWGRTPL
jgi:hypothetical protein